MSGPGEFVVHGVRPSFFTRKVTGYLDYKRLPWWLSPDVGAIPGARAEGWGGGIPAVEKPDGTWVWNSTDLIVHLDHEHPDPSVSPPDPTRRFLAFAIDDYNDEWLYRPAVGTRWLIEENRVTGSWDIARDASYSTGIPAEVRARMRDAPPPPSGDSIREFVAQAMTELQPRIGVTPENLHGGWLDDSLAGWMDVLQAHLSTTPYLFGERPSLADFALVGSNLAHFINDPWCRRWVEPRAPRAIEHAQALATSRGRQFGDWGAEEVPETMIALLSEIGRHYLPWVSEATRSGSASLNFADGSEAEMGTTPFLDEARGVLIARYAALRNDELDAVLDRAGILGYYADHLDQATTIPDPAIPPQPVENRPYPAGP